MVVTKYDVYKDARIVAHVVVYGDVFDWKGQLRHLARPAPLI
jgi:hypothetical protein